MELLFARFMTKNELKENIVLKDSPIERGYLSLKVLSEKYGYAKDYLGQLSRSGRIEAVRYGKYGQWYATEISVKKYQLSLSQSAVSESKPEILPWEVPLPAEIISNSYEPKTIIAPNVLSAVLFKNDGSYSADPGLISQENSPRFSVLGVDSLRSETSELGNSVVPERINAILTLSIVLGGILFFTNIYPVVNLDKIWTPLVSKFSENFEKNIQSVWDEDVQLAEKIITASKYDIVLAGTEDVTASIWSSFNYVFKEVPLSLASKFSEILKNKIRSALDIKPIEKIITVIREVPALNKDRSELKSSSQVISRQITINRDLGPIDLEAIRSELFDTKFKISAIQTALSSLGSDVVNLAFTKSSNFQLPPTNTIGIGPVTLNPNRLESETLSVTGGSILGSLTVLNDFTVDTNTLYVNSTNNRVGIGTTNLETAFELVGTASISGGLSVGSLSIGSGGSSLLDVDLLHVTSSGVGIGTTNPVTLFEVQGTASASNLLTVGSLQVANGGATVSYSRFGTDATSHASNIDSAADLLISGDLEINGGIFIDGSLALSEASASFYYAKGNTAASPSFSFTTDKNTGFFSPGSDIVAISTGGTERLRIDFDEFTVTGSGSFTGQLKTTRAPVLAHTGTWPSFTNTFNSTLYINPTSPVADGNIIAYVSGTDPKFVVDAEGDIYGNNLILTGSTTLGTTTVEGDLIIEGNTNIGDASTDNVYVRGTVVPKTLSSIPLSINASASQTVDVFRITNPNDDIVLTVDQNTGLLTASSGFNFALGFSTATVSYSRLGTVTTTHSNYISKFDDFLISGDLEVRASVTFAGMASISNTLFVDSTNRVVGIGTTSPASTALLDLTSTTKGFLPPRVTTTQRDDISSPATGLTVYNTTLNKMNIYNGSSWKNVGSTEIGGEVTSGTAGSILFVDVSGNLGQDNTNFYWNDTNNRLGIGAAPSTVLEIQGTASASYLLTGNTLQVGGFASAAYSRFGTGTTNRGLSATNDLLVTGYLEVDSSASFDSGLEILSFASASLDTGNFNINFQGTGDFTVQDNATTFFTLSDTGTLTMTGLSTFSGGVSVSTNFELTGNTRLGINAGNNTDTSLEVGGTASISGNVTFGSKASISSNLQISGRFISDSTTASNSFLGSLAITKSLTAGNAFYGANLTDCDAATTSKLLWDAVSGKFSCGTDTDTGTTIASNSLGFGAFTNSPTLDANLTINRNGYFIGIGATPSTVLEIQGTASASYLLTGNTLQVGGFASAAYSRFGVSETGYTNFITTTNDLLISGDLEVNATSQFDSFVRISNNNARAFVITDTGTVFDDIFVVDTTASSTNSGLTITAGPAQTGPLFELKSSGGTILSRFSDEGGFLVNISSRSAFMVTNPDFPDASTSFVIDTLNSETRISALSTKSIGFEVFGVASISNSLMVGPIPHADGLASLSKFFGESGVWINGALCVDNGETSAANDCGDANRLAGTIYSTSAVVDINDLAENFPTTDTLIEAGDVVMPHYLPAPAGLSSESNDKYSFEFVKKSNKNELPMGVVTDRPGILLGGMRKDSDPRSVKKVAVVLSGRVPVKVSLENGPVKEGDRLAPSSVPGIAAKSIRPGIVVGIALEPVTSSSLDFSVLASDSFGQTASVSYSKALSFINLSYWVPPPSEAKVDTAQKVEQGLDPLLDYLLTFIKEAFNIVFEKGIIQTVKGIFDTVEVKDGITIYDKVTNDPYCISFENGIMVTTADICGENKGAIVNQNLTPTPTPTPDPTPTLTPDPTPTPTVDPTPTPTPELTPEPTPISTPEPTPESTLTPSPTPTPTPEPTPEPTPII